MPPADFGNMLTVHREGARFVHFSNFAFEDKPWKLTIFSAGFTPVHKHKLVFRYCNTQSNL
jgi:hypothetical protein